jgi:hypothetical protein
MSHQYQKHREERAARDRAKVVMSNAGYDNMDKAGTQKQSSERMYGGGIKPDQGEVE